MNSYSLPLEKKQFSKITKKNFLEIWNFLIFLLNNLTHFELSKGSNRLSKILKLKERNYLKSLSQIGKNFSEHKKKETKSLRLILAQKTSKIWRQKPFVFSKEKTTERTDSITERKYFEDNSTVLK